jgi:cobalt-zinc-cadmium efflux system outer membrane protein
MRRRHARIVTADRVIDVTSLSAEDRERLLAAAVREQAGRVLAAARTVGVTDELLDLNRRSRDLLQARVKEGAAPELDLNLVDVEVRRLQADRATQVADAEASLIELKALVGLRPDAELRLRDDLEQLVRAQALPAPPLDAIDEAIASRADVREAAARVTLASARVGELTQEGKLEWSVYGSYSRMAFGFPLRGLQSATGQFVPITDVFHSVTVGAMVAIPLLDRNQGAVSAAEAARRVAEQEARARELSARAELAAATTRDRAARSAIELYDSGVRELSRRNLDVVREAYALGRTPLFDVFEQQRRFLDVERAYTDALARAYQQRTALQRAVGDLR